MPLGLDTEQTFPITLLTDEHLPAERRPVFHCRFRTPRQIAAMREQMRRASDLIDAWGEKKDEATWPTVKADAARIVAGVIAGAISRAERFVDENGASLAVDIDSLIGSFHLSELAAFAWACINKQEAAVEDFFISARQRSSPSDNPQTKSSAQPVTASGPIDAPTATASDI